MKGSGSLSRSVESPLSIRAEEVLNRVAEFLVRYALVLPGEIGTRPARPSDHNQCHTQTEDHHQEGAH